MSKSNVLKQHDFKFNHSLGQNFIFDTNLLQSIVSDAKISKDTTVLEIGAGAGTLTDEIAKACKKVFSVEIDKKLQPILKDNLAHHNNVEFIFDDVLKIDTQTLEKKINDTYTIVANLPYYITTPILFKFLDESTRLSKLVVMVQKEVADRLQSKPNSKDYGVLAINVQAVADVSVPRIVKRHMFTPAPNVDSAIVVIELKPNKYDIKDIAFFKNVVKACFAMRRKTLHNNLKQFLPNLSALQLQQVFDKTNILPSTRAETLKIEDFVLLANTLINHI